MIGATHEDGFWPRFYLAFGTLAHGFSRLWHRYRIRGWQRVPQGPVMFVGNHSGIGIVDVLCLLGAWRMRMGLSRRVVGMMHDSFLAFPIVGHFARWFGASRAHPDNARAVLGGGRDLVVFPGGDLDAGRPLLAARKVVFGPRRGYVRIALDAGVPIVPVATIGSHYTYLQLPISKPVGTIARAAGLTRSRYVCLPYAWVPMIAAAVMVALGVAPWWVLVVAAAVLFVPNPVRVTTEFLPPIDVVTATRHLRDPGARVEAAHQLVHRALSDRVAQMEHRAC